MEALPLDYDASPPPAPILPIFLVVLVDVFGMTLVLPLLSIYAEHFKATALAATLLVSVYAACQLISGPIIGQISDRIGRKPMLLLSQIGTCIGFIILARATTLWVIYVSRIIDGATAGNISLAQAYISDNTDKKNRAKSFGFIGIAFGVGFFLGPSLTGYLSGKYGLSTPIYLAALMSLTSIICTATLLRGGKPPQHPTEATDNPGPGGKRVSIVSWGKYVDYFRRPELRDLLFEFTCFIFCFSLFTSGFALFAERRFLWKGHPFTPREIGYFFGYAGFLGIILQGGLIGRLVAKFGERQLVAAGFASLIIGYFGLGLSHTVLLLLVVATISSFGNGVLRPILSSLITQNAGRHEQGAVLGLTQSLMSAAAIVAPGVAGLLIEHDYLTTWASVAGVTAIIGCILARKSLKSVREGHGTDAFAMASGGGPVESVPPENGSDQPTDSAANATT